MKRITRRQEGTIVALGLMLILIVSLQILSINKNANLDISSERAHMLYLVNMARNDAGLPSLYMEEQLTEFADSYSDEMIQYDFFDHVSPVTGSLQQRIEARGITGWKLAGENLAKTTSVDKGDRKSVV